MSWLTDVENELTKVAVGTRAADAEKGILGNFFSAKTFFLLDKSAFLYFSSWVLHDVFDSIRRLQLPYTVNRFTVDTHITHKDRDIIYTLYIYGLLSLTQ